jgi:hypothetical protein
MNTAAYTGHRGRDVHACMSSTTRSVIRETVSLDTDAPYTSPARRADPQAKWTLISPVVNPLAYNDYTTVSTSDSRPLPLLDDHRLEAGVPVAGDLDLDRSDLGEHRLGPGAVAGVAAPTADWVVLVIAQVLSHLRVQRGLQHVLGQLVK